MDKNDLKITKAKAQADGKYFSLFEKHIPAALADDSRVLLYALGNIDCIYKIISKNPRAEYFIYDSDRIITAVKLICDEVRIFKSVDMYDIDMKFDCIIMNPPYERNLHLKILAEAIKHLKDEKSRVVNLSPVQWLEDPLNNVKSKSDYNKFKSTVSSKIISLDIIKSEKGNEYFNIGLMSDLGVYVCSKNNGTFDFDHVKWVNTNKTIFSKIIKTTEEQFPKLVDFNELDKTPFVPIKLIANPYRNTAFNVCTSTFKWICDGKLPNGQYWKDGIYKSKSMNDDKHLVGVKFATVLEAKNFYNSTITCFFKYANKLVKGTNQHVNVTYLPWMGDAINPRTGKKGYESEWTDEDFYKFFNITDDEKKIIEDTMAKYTK